MTITKWGNMYGGVRQLNTISLVTGSSVSNITASITLVGVTNSDLATALAIKTYVDNSILSSAPMFRYNGLTISGSTTLTAIMNCSTVGPVLIETGTTIIVPTGTTWVIL